MAVVTRLSTLVSNWEAQPRVLSSGYQAGGNDTIGVATVATVATDSIGSIYRFGFIPSGVRIEDIQIQNDATTAGVWDVGVYNNDLQACTTVTGGVTSVTAAGAVPATDAQEIFNDAGVSTAAASPTWISIFRPSILGAGFLAANVILRVWELLGLDKDPFYEFNLALTATTAPTAVGNISLQWAWIR
jgi:hypothetical protein